MGTVDSSTPLTTTSGESPALRKVVRRAGEAEARTRRVGAGMEVTLATVLRGEDEVTQAQEVGYAGHRLGDQERERDPPWHAGERTQRELVDPHVQRERDGVQQQEAEHCPASARVPEGHLAVQDVVA